MSIACGAIWGLLTPTQKKPWRPPPPNPSPHGVIRGGKTKQNINPPPRQHPFKNLNHNNPKTHLQNSNTQGDHTPNSMLRWDPNTFLCQTNRGVGGNPIPEVEVYTHQVTKVFNSAGGGQLHMQAPSPLIPTGQEKPPKHHSSSRTPQRGKLEIPQFTPPLKPYKRPSQLGPKF